jgi:hypothetical protein
MELTLRRRNSWRIEKISSNRVEVVGTDSLHTSPVNLFDLRITAAGILRFLPVTAPINRKGRRRPSSGGPRRFLAASL